MHRLPITLLGIVLFLGIQADVSASPPQATGPDAAHGFQWKKAAAHQGLRPKEIEQLDKDKLLVGNQEYRQVFTPYLGGDVPMFITSDSLLNGFHVLFEESVLRLEQANMRKLGHILRHIEDNLATAHKDFEGNPQLAAAAQTRAKLLIAIAMLLLGEEPKGLQRPLLALAKEEAARVEAAKGQQKPAWLGPPGRGFVALDYTRYRPRGFYTKTAALERYFHAVSWLQSIPLRLGNDEELATVLMLGICLRHDHLAEAESEEFSAFIGCFETFVGAGDDLGVGAVSPRYAKIDLGAKGLAEMRKDCLEMATRDGSGPQINDQLAFAPEDPSQAAEISFRVLPSRRTPDGVLFGRTTDPRKFHRCLPTGLEVRAALGSPYARSRLAGEESGRLLAEVDRSKALKALFDVRNLYGDYLRCLEALFAKPEPDAPPFMSSEAWQIKSCQTALSGWAQLRHTWALQAKQNVEYLCDSEVPPGFVEPVPDFFSRMAAIVESAEALFKAADCLASGPKQTAAELREGASLMEKWATPRKAWEKSAKNGDKTKPFNPLEGFSSLELSLLGRTETVLFTIDATLERRDPAEAACRVRALADDVEQGRPPKQITTATLIQIWDVDLVQQWRTLGILCRRLESLAHKQLRRVPFNDEENNLIRSYGEKLAAVMLYRGNSYFQPFDDAPRVTDVYFNPNTARVLEVGIARPRAIYVLYPAKGGDLLCRGAILPYCEFAHDTRLTDAEWQTLLDSPQRPKTPDWIKPILAPGGPVPPKTHD